MTTTAKHRSRAYDAFERGDYTIAAKEYEAAIKTYKANPRSQLDVADLSNLTSRLELSRKMAKWRPK